MSLLTLVRHAQASFHSDDYDQLSPHGEKQARALAEHWFATDQEFDEVYVGPRRRQQQTAAIIAERYAGGGRELPPAIVLPSFDEHQLDVLVTQHREEMCRRSDTVARLYDAYDAQVELVDKERRFQRLFETLATHWVRGDCPSDVESHSEFRTRIHSGLNEILAREASGRRAFLVTSLGSISVSLERVLECPAEKAIDTGWRIWNSSLTDVVFSKGRVSLDRFNALPHLPDRSDWTYR